MQMVETLDNCIWTDMVENPIVVGLVITTLGYGIWRGYWRLQLSLAKHPSIRGHAKWSRRIAKFIPYFSYNTKEFFCVDSAPVPVVKQREEAFAKLSKWLENRAPRSVQFTQSLNTSISDVQFTQAYRVPFPFRDHLNSFIKTGSIATQSLGTQVCDLDGNWHYDLSGSYGVNVFGYDFYKRCMAQGVEKVKPLGPVLGPYHPVIKENVEKLKMISRLDEVSFHMSGTEAVMQAVRLARYHTGKSHLVRFCGAYHGWWDGVQPGVGNSRCINDVYTLRDLSDQTLKVLLNRNDIACVLINPLQAFRPNADAAGDGTLIASNELVAFDKARYVEWLNKLRAVCTQRNIVLIFDEVFTGFRLSHRGAQGYFKIQADMVTYGKTLGGGLPVGVLCGRHDLMARFKEKQPANVALARGTFNSHPWVMGTMNEFLQQIEAPEYQRIYETIETQWDQRVTALNNALADHDLPVRFTNMHTVLSTCYTLPSAYNWLFQFYLHAEGLQLGWNGSGRMIMSFDFSDTDFAAVKAAIIRAAQRMLQDGWWWQSEGMDNREIKRRFATNMLWAKFSWFRLIANSMVGKNRRPREEKRHGRFDRVPDRSTGAR